MDQKRTRPEITQLMAILESREVGGVIMASNPSNLSTLGYPEKNKEGINDILLPTGWLRGDRE